MTEVNLVYEADCGELGPQQVCDLINSALAQSRYTAHSASKAGSKHFVVKTRNYRIAGKVLRAEVMTCPEK